MITVLLNLKSAEAIAAQRLAMIAHLDEVRGFMEELSPELGLDPLQEILFLKLVIIILDSKSCSTSIHFKIFNSIINSLP